VSTWRSGVKLCQGTLRYSKSQADARASWARENGWQARAFRCGACGDWHVTAATVEPRASRRANGSTKRGEDGP
jgi:hypothetical protein